MRDSYKMKYNKLLMGQPSKEYNIKKKAPKVEKQKIKEKSVSDQSNKHKVE
jgi:hypothetical protein